MSTKNIVSIQIPQEDLQVVRDALATLQATLAPYLLVAAHPANRGPAAEQPERYNDAARILFTQVMLNSSATLNKRSGCLFPN